MIANNIEELIGNTPLVKINSLSNETGVTILGKCEFMNPTSSVKDRIAFNMINEALKSGDINQDTTHHRTYKRQHRHRLGCNLCSQRFKTYFNHARIYEY